MNHHEITQSEIVERYVQHRLTAEERLAFQEHYFACVECFAQVQTAARFVAGVREAGRAGILDNPATKVAAAAWASWFKPAFALTAVAALLLAVTLGWLLLAQLPRLRGDVARERQEREQAERENRERLAQANGALENERQQREAERVKLQNQIELLAQNKPPALPDGNSRTQANTPLVILDAVRGSRAGESLVLSDDAVSATVWIEVETGNRFASYRLQILSSDGRPIQTIGGAKPNSYGAVAVTLPARLLPPGKYRVKLSGVKGRDHELVGEYDLNVRKGK